MLTQTLQLSIEGSTLTRILLLGFLGFLVSMAITPIYTSLAYRGKWWKKPRETAVTGETAKVFSSLHAKKHERHIPTMAGLIFVATVAAITVLLNLDRSQTWLPLAAFVGAAGIGLVDDIINIRGVGKVVAG